MSTFERVEIENRAQELYESHHINGAPWSRRGNAIREAYRSAAARLLKTKPPAPVQPCVWPECGDACLGRSVACK